MKKLIIPAIVGMSMFLSGNVQAHSQFNLKMFDNSVFSVMFDGNCAGQQVSSVSFSNVCGGQHMLKVVKYFFNPFCGMPQPKVVFCGSIVIPEDAIVNSVISCHGCYEVISVQPLCGNNGWGGCGSGPGYGNGWNTGYDPNYGNGYGYPPYMSPQVFEQLKYTIDSKNFDSSKLQVAKQAIASNYLTSAQVAQLMNLMDFESSRLSLAEFAYPRTVDKQNYYLVNNSFDFESSISELNRYITHL